LYSEITCDDEADVADAQYVGGSQYDGAWQDLQGRKPPLRALTLEE
jgi:hypothetical protein